MKYLIGLLIIFLWVVTAPFVLSWLVATLIFGIFSLFFGSNEKNQRIRQYVLNLFVGIDQLVNALFFGDPDETISSRLGKSEKKENPGWFSKILIKFLDWFEENHCEESIEYDEGSKKLHK